MRDSILERVGKRTLQDTRLVLLVGDLGVYQLREYMAAIPERIINFGIMEQAMIGFAAGLSRGKAYPIIYSITPFIVDRAFEQIKLDLCYNMNSCLILSAGGSYDYSTLGPSHHCQHDIGSLMQIGFDCIMLPFNIEDAKIQVDHCCSKKMLAYMRISSIEESIISDEYTSPETIVVESNGIPVLRLNRKSSKPDNKKALVVVGPDGYLMAKIAKIPRNEDAVHELLVISEDSLTKLAAYMSVYETITICAGFNLSIFAVEFINYLKYQVSGRKTLNLLHTRNGFIFDKCGSKEEALAEALEQVSL